MVQVQAQLDSEEHERLEKIKESNGLTWRGMLLVAGRELADE